MPSGLEKIIALIRRTGDRCIVVDSAGNPAYVILPLEEYEQLAAKTAAPAGSSADQLFDEIQRDVELRSIEPASTQPMDESVPPLGNPDDHHDRYYFEPIE